MWMGCTKLSLLRTEHLSTAFLQAVLSETNKVWGSSFFGKCQKFNLNFENAK